MKKKKETAKTDEHLHHGDVEQDPWKIHKHTEEQKIKDEMDAQWIKCEQNDRYENDDDRIHYENSSELMLTAIKYRHQIESRNPWVNYKRDFFKAFETRNKDSPDVIQGKIDDKIA